MPKSKPDEVVVHRIEFQQHERELLDQIGTAVTFERVASPIISLMKDVTAMAIFLTALIAIFPGILKHLPEGWENIATGDATPEELSKWYDDHTDPLNVGLGTIGAILGALLTKTTVGAGAGYAVGDLAAEEIEQVIEDAPENRETMINEAQRALGRGFMFMWNTIHKLEKKIS